MPKVGITALVVAASAATLLTACQSTSTSSGNQISVTSSDTACELSANTAEAGTITFKVTNATSQVTEFYFLGSDGVQVVGEVENIGPGLSRDLVVEAAAGNYLTACKPGMVGDGIRAPFTVTPSANGPTATASGVAAATTSYTQYVKSESNELTEDTQAFAAAFAAGDTAKAKALYASTRMHWERIEPVAESFGDLDPRLDLREADLEAGQVWTGWHRAEKDLWPPAGYQPMTQAQRQKLANQLVADTNELNQRVQALQLTPSQMTNGAKELLDEVATGKVTGEEEAWSHTDLWDFKANVEGAQQVYEAFEPIVEQKNPQLAATIEQRFDALNALLAKYQRGDGYVYYNELTPAQVKQLSQAVDALGEPLSQLTVTVVK